MLCDVSSPVDAFGHQFLIGITTLRVLVKEFHVRMCWRGVEIVIQLLDVLAVVSLMACYSKQAFLEDGILAVPEGKAKANALVVVRYSRDAIFTPSIRARARVFVRKMSPGVAICRIILANGCLVTRQRLIKRP
jgi:hypothetical protein